MRILVTGSSGFVAEYLIEKLESDKINFLTIDKVQSKHTKLIVDISNIKNLQQVFLDYKPTHVIHLAAETNTKIKILYYNDNIIGTQNITSCCVNFNVQKLVFTSSMLAIPDDFNFTFDSNTLSYGASKKSGEDFITNSLSLNWSIIRPTLVYGKLMNEYHTTKFAIAAKIIKYFKLDYLTFKKSMCDVNTLVDIIIKEVFNSNTNSIMYGCDKEKLSIEDLICLKFDLKVYEKRLKIPNNLFLVLLKLISPSKYKTYKNSSLTYDFNE